MNSNPTSIRLNVLLGALLIHGGSLISARAEAEPASEAASTKAEASESEKSGKTKEKEGETADKTTSEESPEGDAKVHSGGGGGGGGGSGGASSNDNAPPKEREDEDEFFTTNRGLFSSLWSPPAAPGSGGSASASVLGRNASSNDRSEGTFERNVGNPSRKAGEPDKSGESSGSSSGSNNSGSSGAVLTLNSGYNHTYVGGAEISFGALTIYGGSLALNSASWGEVVKTGSGYPTYQSISNTTVPTIEAGTLYSSSDTTVPGASAGTLTLPPPSMFAGLHFELTSDGFVQTLGNRSWSYTSNNGVLLLHANAVTVPEPSLTWLVAVGLAARIARRRR